MPARNPTIQDVAARAGVSVATVSRAMNDPERVREETRQRVDEAIDALEYRPSWLARDLRQDKTSRVLVLFPTLHSPVMADVFRGIDDAARTDGYFSLICPTAKDPARERELIEMLRNRSVDGIILFGTTMDPGELEQLGEKHAIVQVAEWKEAATTSRVSIDDLQAAHDMTEHLIALGHTRIAMTAAPAEASSGLRTRGFRLACERAGIKVDESLIFPGDYEFVSGRKALAELMSRSSPPTALFCISDVVAAGAVAEARERGLSVPGDIAIAGFDDSREATMSTPELTTIRQPFYDIGRRAMETLMGNLAEPADRRTVQDVLPHELVVRGSTVGPGR